MTIGHHDTVSITEKSFEEYHLYWHDSEGVMDDKFIVKIYGHVDVAANVARAISHLQCEYISYPVVVKSWSEWENEND